MATENLTAQQHNQRQSSLINSSTEKAKVYIQTREIPQLFEALMTGLMFKQPDDHIEYIIACLQKVKANAQKGNGVAIRWNSFIGGAAAGAAAGATTTTIGADLPPLKDNSNIVNQVKVINEAKAQPLSGFNQLRKKYESPLPSIENRSDKSASIGLMFLIAPSGLDKIHLGKDISARFDGLLLLNMSELLLDYLSTNRDRFEKKLVETTLTMIKRHQMVSDELAFEALGSALSKYEKWNGVQAILVVGFPRTVQQAMDWEKFGKKVNRVILLNSKRNRSIDPGLIEFYGRKMVLTQLSEELPEQKRVDVAVNAIKDLNLSIRYIDDECSDNTKQEASVETAAHIKITNVDENDDVKSN